MKITKQRLREIIKEEIADVEEGVMDTLKAVGSAIKGDKPSMSAQDYINKAKRNKDTSAFNDLYNIATGKATPDLKNIMTPREARKIIVDAFKLLKINEVETMVAAIIDELGGA